MMKRQSLDNLLKNADAIALRAAGGDCDPTLLAELIRGRARRRRHGRWSLLAAALLLGLIGVVALALAPRGNPPMVRSRDDVQVISQRDPAEIEAEVFQLRRQIEQGEMLVNKLLEAERRGRLAAELAKRRPSPDALAAIRYEQDRAALILVHQAQRFDDELHKRLEAADTYRRVLALFPESQWADVARRRLDEMQG